ncbi:hypothetical protein BRC79_09695 [Halobacteriales archaeon QH_8_67_27]|nr:MAG: hypothetical protein BRC79_09695 [Halobacteriales archaeon QH_8_67_27]
MAGPVSKTLFGTSRGEDDEYELMPTSLYLFGGLTLPLYPLGVFVNPFWITLGALFVTLTVVRDAYRLVNGHDSGWRWAYVYPFAFVVGFAVYPLLLPVYLYHRRRGAARAAGMSYADVQAVRDEMDVPTPRTIYGLLGYDLLVQVVLIGSTSGLLFAGSVAPSTGSVASRSYSSSSTCSSARNTPSTRRWRPTGRRRRRSRFPRPTARATST